MINEEKVLELEIKLLKLEKQHTKMIENFATLVNALNQKFYKLEEILEITNDSIDILATIVGELDNVQNEQDDGVSH